MKLLGLDVGEKRIGVAVSEGEVVSTLNVIENNDIGQTINEVGKIARRENAKKIIIGIPKNKDNFQTDKIHKFALELTKNLNIEVEYVDETLTSKEAERLVGPKKRKLSLKKYKKEIDKESARLILEQYLKKVSKV